MSFFDQMSDLRNAYCKCNLSAHLLRFGKVLEFDCSLYVPFDIVIDVGPQNRVRKGPE